MHRHARAFFVLAVLAASVTLGLAARAAVTPKPVPIVVESTVAVTRIRDLEKDKPALFTLKELAGLESKARRLRNWTFGRVDDQSGLSFYLVRHEDGVSGYIARDPRTGCLLEWVGREGLFHDVCHGSVYTIDGERAGGPSPFSLDQLVISVTGDRVFVSLRDVVPGRMPARF